MRGRLPLLAVIGVLLLGVLACARAGTGPVDTTGSGDPGGPPPIASPAPPAPPAPPPPSRAGAAVAAAAAVGDTRSGVTLGVAVLDRETGEIAVDEDGDTPLRAASVVKLYTALDLLLRRATVPVAPADEQRIRSALGPSDDAAMNALWSTRDGPAGIERVVEDLGLTGTELPSDTSQWGEVTTSARDVAVAFAAVTERLAPADRELVLSALAAAPATAADGFDQGFGLLDPDTRGAAAAKQGWLCCLEGGIELHSAGLLDPAGRYAVVLLSRQPFGYPAARSVLDDAAAAARTALAAA